MPGQAGRKTQKEWRGGRACVHNSPPHSPGHRIPLMAFGGLGLKSGFPTCQGRDVSGEALMEAGVVNEKPLRSPAPSCCSRFGFSSLALDQEHVQTFPRAPSPLKVLGLRRAPSPHRGASPAACVIAASCQPRQPPLTFPAGQPRLTAQFSPSRLVT